MNLSQYYEHIEEMEWAIEECLKTSLPVAASMCIGPEGDMHGVSAAECAIRMAKAGAHVVGINCHFDPFVSLECLKKMKAGLDAANLKPYLMCQVHFVINLSGPPHLQVRPLSPNNLTF